MDDSFHEIIVKGLRSQHDGLKIFGLLVATFVLIILIVVFSAYLGILMPLLLGGVGYGLFYLLRGFSREFEYTVTNGDLDIDLIIAQRKRKRVFSGSARQFKSMAPINSAAPAKPLEPSNASSNLVIDCRGRVLSQNQNLSQIHYKILADYQGKHVQVLFTPDEPIVKLLKKFNPARIVLG